jgi:hypothetical protein
MTRERLGLLAAAAAIGISASASGQITFGQIDTFSDGTTMGWGQGPVAIFPSTNEPTGGPAGDGDRWLRNVSTGSNFESGRQVIINQSQWRGDYPASGVTRISADIANFGTTTLYMRVAVEYALLGSAWWASTNPIEISPGSGWQRVHFDLTPGAMSDLTNGIVPLATTLGNVGTVRLLSARTAPNFRGDRLNAVVGFDNITAVPEPGAIALVAGTLLCAVSRRGGHPSSSASVST